MQPIQQVENGLCAPVWMGMLTMVLQGIVMGWMHPRFRDTARPVFSGWHFAMCVLVILGGYIAIVEPSKYAVPSIRSWVLVEGSVAFVQFSLFGALLGVIHQRVR